MLIGKLAHQQIGKYFIEHVYTYLANRNGTSLSTAVSCLHSLFFFERVLSARLATKSLCPEPLSCVQAFSKCPVVIAFANFDNDELMTK